MGPRPAASDRPRVAVIGGGPAGLMAAEAARAAGADVDLYEAKGSVGRKFLIAGRGGLNLTHSEPRAKFVARYGTRAPAVGAWLEDFDAKALRAWAKALGIETFIGSSGRVFPTDFKAAPLLRHWVHRLREAGVRFRVRHRWTGWRGDALVFSTEAGELEDRPDAVVLALGGASWPQLGSDGAWVPWLEASGVEVAPLEPANCGFDADFSPHFAGRHAGEALKSVVARVGDHVQQGECVVTATGLEGQLVYALSTDVRAAIARDARATMVFDLAPGHTREWLEHELAAPRGGRSRSEHWRRRVHIHGAKAGLVHEHLPRAAWDDAARVAAAMKALPVTLLRPRPSAEAISTAGGVRLEALDATLMAKAVPGLFCAGEMLDWEAPTGGYLLTACFASGVRAGRAAALCAMERSGLRTALQVAGA